MGIEIFPGAVQFNFPEEVAKKTIRLVNESNKTWVDSSVGSGTVAKHIRSSLSFDLDALEISKNEIRPILYDCVKKYSNYYETPIYRDESLNLLRYESYDKYEYHVDYGGNMRRSVSCLIYLNPGEYSGGGTNFKHFNYTINPESPALVLFPSNYPYLHAAEPVSEGVKYIIVTWMYDESENLLSTQSCSCQ